MKNFRDQLLLLALGMFLGAAFAMARGQVILNGNFETGASQFSRGGNGQAGLSGNPNMIPDWSFGSNLGANPGSSTGFGLGGVDPETNVLGPADPGSTSDPDYAWIYHSGYLEQQVDFLPNYNYTLTVDVAIRAGGAGVPYYVIDYGDGTTAAPTENVTNFAIAPNNSTFTTETIAFSTTNGGPGYILFGNDPIGLPQGEDQTVDFANFYLYGIDPPIPEPGTWGMLVAGCLVLAVAVRRRGARG